MKQDLVSVIIPYFKKKKFFDRTINSVISQTYKNFEILIIYDDENREELNFIKKFIKKKEVRLIVNKKNLGAGKSRNIGINMSKGKFIAFIDSDDVWHKDKLKKQIYIMKKKNYKFTHTSYDIINQNHKIIGTRYAKKYLNHSDLLKSCDIGLSTVIIEKKFLKNQKFPSLKTKEDYVMWLNLSKKINIIGLDRKYTKWRKLSNSLSSNTLQKLIDGFRVYNYHQNYNIFTSFVFLIRLSFNFIKKTF